jgi:hypothetical protein
MSTNEHNRITVILVAVSAVSLGVGYFATRTFGLPGAAWSLLGVDVLMTCVVLRTSLRQLQDRATDFFRAMFNPPALLSSAHSND